MMSGITEQTLSRMQVAAAFQRLQTAANGPDALAAVGEIVSQLIGCEEYALFAAEPGRASLTLVAAVGINVAGLRGISAESGYIGRAASQGKMYIVSPFGALPGVPQETHLTACVPLRHGSRIAGVLALFRLLPHKGRLATSDTELLGLLSAYGSAALAGRAMTSPALLVPPEPTVSEPALTPGTRAVFLHPGEVQASTNPAEVTTILGSSVAVCLWDTRLRYWGMCHYLMAETGAGQPASRRLGETALPALLAEVLGLGGQRHHLRAKIFGGAAVGSGAQPGGAGLGQKNIELARQWLAEAGIPIIAEDVGGTSGRKLRFRTLDGTVLIKQLGFS